MKRLFARLAVLASLIALLPACSGGSTPITPATGRLYVLDRIAKAVFIYDNVATINGAVDPVRTLTGSNTLIDNPTALAVDTRRDNLYVAETTGQQVLTFTQASLANGDTGPARTFPGVQKGSGMFYDLKNDALYVGDEIDLSIHAWDKISTLATGTQPTRRIGLGFQPSTIFYDDQRDLLYVGDPSTASVKIYLNASTLGSSNAQPNATIQDSTQAFVDVNAVALNIPNNIMFVSEDFNPSVEIFDNASTLTGSVPTNRSLEGDQTGFTLDQNQMLFVDNVLYVQQSRTQIGIWDNANAVTGNVAPNRSLTINPATQILSIAIDLAH